MHLTRQSWDGGPGKALLVHGLSSSAAGWWRFAPALASLGYEVTAPDLRGHGATGPADSYRLADYATDLVDIQGSWDLVVGHSLGGAAAAIAAEEHPQWTQRMIMLDPAVWLPSDPETEAELATPFRSPLTVEAVMEANPTWHPNDARFKAEALRQTSAEVVTATLRENLPWNLIPLLTQLSIPTLIVGADPARDAYVPRALGEGLAALSSSIEYRWVRYASHSLHRDEFDATWEIVSEWLGS